MAVCNLFNKLNKPTGNFLMFSQYTEDLTKSSTHPGVFRVSPSKFMVLNIDYSKFTPVFNDNNLKGDDKNLIIPTYFQNYFENGCAYLREILTDSEELKWTPELSKTLFWNAIVDSNLIHVVDTQDKKYCDEIMYIGDINIQSYNEYLGTGYSEIYCSIPPTSSATYTECNINEVIDYYTYDDTIVRGYKDTEKTENMCPLNLPEGVKYYYKDKFVPHICNETCSETEHSPLDRDDKEYSFNTIIILYDTYIMGDNNEYIKTDSNIPMGMYICGTIDRFKTIGKTEEGENIDVLTTSNENTKIVSNDEIYGMGTSYGLRICSRFITTPNQDNIKPIDITVESDNSYAATCMALSEMSKNIAEMRKISEQCVQNSQINKELLAIFKNSRTNVPYTKQIGDKTYWFINGRNTYVQALLTDVDLDLITKQNIDSLFQEKMNEVFKQMRLQIALGY